MIRSALRSLAPALLLGLAAPFALPVAAPAAESSAGDLAAVSKAIRSITTLKANFVQTDARGQVQTGTLLLKQPGQIRFDYGETNLLIVSNGKSLYMVDYDVNQVERWPIRNSPLGALLDPGRDLAAYGKLAETGDPRIVSIDVRDKAHPEAGTISLVFTRKPSAPGGLELYGWLARDAQGNRTAIRFSGHQYGAAIADSAFAWRDPRPKGPR